MLFTTRFEKKKLPPKFHAILRHYAMSQQILTVNSSTAPPTNIYIHISDFGHFPNQKKKKIQVITIFIPHEFRL